MSNTEPAVKAERFIHSTFLNRLGINGESDAVIAKVHQHLEDGSVRPTLKIIRDPQRRFFVTKQGLRGEYNEKKEWEDLHALDEIVCRNSELPREVFKALNGFYPSDNPNLRRLFESPYLYGADISIESLAKAAYNTRFDDTGVSPSELTRGMFDVESSMLTDNYGELIMATISHEEKIYTSILKRNFFVTDKAGNRRPGDLVDLEKMAYQHLDPAKAFPGKNTQKAINGRSFKLHFHLADTPIDILRWTLGKMHENRTDFMGVWNLPFDMVKILETCDKAGVHPGDILCPPELPMEYKRVRFFEDPGKQNDVFHRRWHFLYAPAYTQWYDSMCLYSILRIVSGYEDRYSLDHILKKNDICDGKLTFKETIPDQEDMSTPDWHRHMQMNHSYEYIIYNIFDVISLQVMEWVNNDVAGMHVLAGNSALQNFNKQTRRSADVLYFECLARNKVTATTSPAIVHDNDIVKQGGAVLTPERTWHAGLKAVREAPWRETYAHPHTNDIDLSSVYPNAGAGCNVSRETKTGTIIRIEGMPTSEVRTLSSMLLSIDENAVPIGKQFFGLPGYSEMAKRFKERQTG